MSVENKELRELLTTNPGEFMEILLAGLKVDFSEIAEDCDEGAYDPYHGFSIELVNSEGGTEGGGEYVERVFKITEFNITEPAQEPVYLRRTGFYSSYNGIEYDGEFEIVIPREVIVTEYYTAEVLKGIEAKLEKNFKEALAKINASKSS